VLDSIFFIAFLAGFYALFGTKMLGPSDLASAYGAEWRNTFRTAYIVMTVYGMFFFYGLFIDPSKVKGFLAFVTRIGIFRKYREKALDLGLEFVKASKEMARENLFFHLKAFALTISAWTSRFLLLVCLIVAIVHVSPEGFIENLVLFARIQAMYVMMALSPTPGGTGIAEFVFGGFLRDYVPIGIAFVIAFIWRLMAYYTYLLIGAVIVPNWIGKVIKKEKAAKVIYSDKPDK
jgi:uncharacterized protein (TIRG00374 family)